MNKLLIVCGPTGTGKTKLALSLAKKFNGELVSADSRQVYKGLDALTGKDRSKEVPIWLYDIVEVSQEFNVSHFVKLARSVIAKLQERGKLPIVVGGTGFYLKALTESLDTISIPPNWKLREKLASLSVEELQKLVETKRLEKMNDSDRKNPRRLIRGIEVAGKVTHQSRPKYNPLWIGLTGPLPALKDRITERIRARWDRALGEARDDLPPILGTVPLLSFLKGATTKEKAMQIWANAEFQYAKRQMTWFKKQANIVWFNVENNGFQTNIEAHARGWYTADSDI